MSEIFLSHSSLDAPYAAEVMNWLKERNLSSVFLDFDPARGIPGGRDWESELYAHLKSCRVVIALCSRHSMESKWCFAEITQARALGKALIPIRIDDTPLDPGLMRLQVINLSSGDAYARIEGALLAAGVERKTLIARHPARPPFPGLEPFQEQDAEFFFGRTKEISRLAETLNRGRRLQGSQIVIVVGASGVGKSSFVRAGVLPRMRADTEEWVAGKPFRPGRDPAATLENAIASVEALRRNLHRPDANALVVVDQLEELFSVADAASAGRFLRSLHALVEEPGSRVTFLGTLRSDFVPELLAHPEVRTDAIEVSPLEPIRSSQLRAIIVEPARAAGVEIEPVLEEQLSSDFDADGTLPLLAFVLRQLYERRLHGALRSETYELIGGLPGAIGKAAEECLPAHLSAELESALRSALLQLVRITDDDRFARRSARWDELSAIARPLLERLVRARVLVSWTDDDHRVLDVAHDFVFQAWPRLAAWLQDDREKLVTARRVHRAAQHWVENDRDPVLLWKGAKLESVSDLNFDASAAEFIMRSREMEAKREDYRRLRMNEMKRYLTPMLTQKTQELAHWEDVVRQKGTIAGISSKSDVENEIAVINNFLNGSGRWHPSAPESVHTYGALRDYMEVYKFLCCGTTVTGGDTPSRLRPDGCEPVPILET
jgi:hypothetical protein